MHDGLLPTLDPDVTLFRPPSRRSTALHALVADAHRPGAETLWIDAGNRASTYALTEHASESRALSGISVARAFTAYQHHSLVREAVRCASPETVMVVVPRVDALYADEDVPDREGDRLLSSSLAALAELGSVLSIPVLVTAADPAVVQPAVDRELDCERTDFGLRFEGETFETDCYRCAGAWQTTIPYWVDLFGAVVEVDRPAPELAPVQRALEV